MLDFDFNHLPIFQDLPDEQRLAFLSLFSPCEFKEGETIFGQGERAASLYLVVIGEVAVRYKPEDGPELIVARIRPNGIVGWSAALGSPAYTSSVDCLMDCLLLRLTGDDLRNLCISDPQSGAILVERLALVIAERLRNTHGHVLALLEQGLHLDLNQYLRYKEISPA